MVELRDFHFYPYAFFVLLNSFMMKYINIIRKKNLHYHSATKNTRVEATEGENCPGRGILSLCHFLKCVCIHYAGDTLSVGPSPHKKNNGHS